MATQLRIGDKVVYPAHGPGVVVALERKVISGSEQVVYVLRMIHNGGTILIPVAKVEDVGIRSPISLGEIERVFSTLGDNPPRAPEPPEPWNRRHRQYREKIRTGSIPKIVEVLKTLHLDGRTRDLSLGEKKMLDAAMGLLVEEVCYAKGSQTEKTREEIELLLRTAEAPRDVSTRRMKRGSAGSDDRL